MKNKNLKIKIVSPAHIETPVLSQGGAHFTKFGYAVDIRIYMSVELTAVWVPLFCGPEASLLFTLFCVTVQHLLIQVSWESGALLSPVSGPNQFSVTTSVNFPVWSMGGQGTRIVRLFSGLQGENREPRSLGRSKNY